MLIFKSILILSCAILFAQDSTRIKECKCKNISLHGRVKVVESHADFLVKIVASHPDLEVKKVNYNSNRCGEWRFVDNHADFTVKFVDSHEDFKVKFIE